MPCILTICVILIYREIRPMPWFDKVFRKRDKKLNREANVLGLRK